MSTGGSGARLEALTKELLLQWEATRESWDDTKAQEFEQRYIEELRVSVDAAVNVISHLNHVITKTRSECE